MKQLLMAVATFLALATFSATTAEAKSTTKGPSGATTTRTVVDPATGKPFNVVVMTNHFKTKQEAMKGKPNVKSKALMKKTGWGWSWRLARCAQGAARWWNQWFFLPPWYRGGMAVFGCILG